MARTYHLGFTRRAVNKVVAVLTRRGLGSTYLLTTRGARTGLDRTTPVIPVEVGGERYLVSPYGEVAWVHNVRSSGQVTLGRGDRSDSSRRTRCRPRRPDRCCVTTSARRG